MKRLLAIAVLLSSSAALADEIVLVEQPEQDRPIEWQFDGTVLTEIGLSRGAAFVPVSIAPDLALRSDAIELALYHSGFALTGMHGVALGGSVCVSSDCNAYSGSGLDVFGRVLHRRRGDQQIESDLALWLGGGPVVTSLEPMQLAVKAGAKLRYQRGDAQLEVEPTVLVGATGRDSFADRASVPVRLSLLTLIGIESGVTGTRSSWQIPLTVYGRVPVRNPLTADTMVFLVGALSLPALVASDAVMAKGFDARAVTIGMEVLH